MLQGYRDVEIAGEIGVGVGEVVFVYLFSYFSPSPNLCAPGPSGVTLRSKCHLISVDKEEFGW